MRPGRVSSAALAGIVFPPLVFLTLAAPHVIAESAGWEDLPELTDALDDVDYHDLYAGPQDHAYLDIAAAWFDYSNQTDLVRFVLKVKDATQLESPPVGWTLACSFHGEVTFEDEALGTLGYFWTKAADADGLNSGVRWDATSSSSRVGSLPAVKHTFNAKLAEPGYFEFFVERPQLLQFGDVVVNLAGVCYESFDPAGNGGVLINNGDGAESASSYSFQEIRRIKGPSGEKDPIEALGPEATAVSDGASRSAAEGTPGFAAITVTAVLAFLAILRRLPG